LWNKTKTVIEIFKPRDPPRAEAALRGFDEENARDPNTEMKLVAPQLILVRLS
jgi:hypothetical protein